MIFNEGTIVKATTLDGKEVHGFVMYDENMEFFVTGETPVLLESLTNIRITEEAPKGEVVDQVVNADIKKVDPKKVKDPEKLGSEREKELIKMKVLKGNEGYKDKFAAGVVVAKAMNGKGPGLFSKSCLDKVKKKESLENMESTNWENFQEGDLNPAASAPIEGDTVIGEIDKEIEGGEAQDTVSSTIEDTTENTEVAPISDVTPTTDLTINNTMIDSDASVTTPTIDDDVMHSSDEITDYSQFLDNPEMATTDITSTTPAEDAIISDALTNTVTPDSTISADDVQITIKNPSEKSIEIKIDGKKEDEINNEIDKELDDYKPENGYTDEGFFEHLCKKYNYENKLVEGESVSSAICRLISEVANR